MKTEPVFRVDLLVAIAEMDDPSGGEIRDRMTEPPYRYDLLRKERVYRNLGKLADDGLIVTEKGGAGKANSYELTDDGRRYLEERLAMLERALQE